MITPPLISSAQPNLNLTAEPISTKQAVTFYLHNFLTLGVSGTLIGNVLRDRVKDLKTRHQDLNTQYTQLEQEWERLEGNFLEIFHGLRREVEEESLHSFAFPTATISNLERTKERIYSTQVEQAPFVPPPSLRKKFLNCITFVGQLLANILTLGGYGLYQYYILKNRVAALSAQNQGIENNKFSELQRKKNDSATHYLEIYRRFSESTQAIQTMQAVDVETVNQLIQTSVQTQADLQNQSTVLNEELEKNQVIYANLLSEKEKVEQLSIQLKQDLRIAQAANQILNQNQQRVNTQINQLRNQINQLNGQLTNLTTSVEQIEVLQTELNRLQAVKEKQGEIQRAQREGGPISSPYAELYKQLKLSATLDASLFADELPASKGDDLGLDDDDEKILSVHAQKINACRTAEALVKEEFSKILRCILSFHLEMSISMTNESRSILEKEIYNLTVYKFISFSKLRSNGCKGYALQLNKQNIVMLSSQPEKILSLKTDLSTNESQPVVEVHYTQQDDFTPSQAVLNTEFGVDPVLAKRFMALLTVEEHDYLIMLLLNNFLSFDSVNYQTTQNFMKQTTNPRVKIVDATYQLIIQIAQAMELKFGSNVLEEEYLKFQQNNI